MSVSIGTLKEYSQKLPTSRLASELPADPQLGTDEKISEQHNANIAVLIRNQPLHLQKRLVMPFPAQYSFGAVIGRSKHQI